MVDGQVGQFSDALQISCQRKGPLVDDLVDSFGWVLHEPKENANHQSSIEFRSTTNISPYFDINVAD
jgi:hypothetical protein